MNRQMVTLIMIFASVLLASLLGVAGPYLMGRAIDDYLTIKNLDGFVSIILLMLLVLRIEFFFFSWLMSFFNSQSRARSCKGDSFRSV